MFLKAHWLYLSILKNQQMLEKRGNFLLNMFQNANKFSVLMFKNQWYFCGV